MDLNNDNNDDLLIGSPFRSESFYPIVDGNKF